MQIDLNCDMGEGIGNDEAIMPFISSANIACGFHAGDVETMKRTVELCLKYNVAIGAHPSYPDRDNFGRTDIYIPFMEIYDIVTDQIYLLDKIAKAAGAVMHHVKPHGALYNMAARGKQRAAIIALALKDVNDNLILYGLSGSKSISEAKAIGVKTASEVFADRTYQDNGTLTSRSKQGALIKTTDQVVNQVLQIIKNGTVTTLSGKEIPITAETVCIHGDGENAVNYAKAIYEAVSRI
jgi:5-oxoprolinase (ATP-hydrolysing) subunit A